MKFLFFKACAGLFAICLFFFPAMSAWAETYEIEGDLAGAPGFYTVKQKDTLYSIARQFDLGIVELMAANPGVDPWIPGPGTELLLPTFHILPDAPHRDIVINLSEMRLYYFPGDGTVRTFPIGIGKEGWPTPLGTTSIVKKRADPTWSPPESILKENPALPETVPAGPDNPLGAYALDLGWPRYLIHGTNRPSGVGRRSSHGCIRLYPEDISTLFDSVTKGTAVTVLDTPYKIGWRDTRLFLEVMLSGTAADGILKGKPSSSRDTLNIENAIIKFATEGTELDWYKIDKAVRERRGVPVAIGKISPPAETKN